MTSPTVTHVSTYNKVKYADHYVVCGACGGWVTGHLNMPEGHGIDLVMPCEHDRGSRDVCPSWGPVDGCQCQEHLGFVPHGEPPSRLEQNV